MKPSSLKKGSFFDFAEKCRREIIRDIIRWPEHKVKNGLMNPESVLKILAERTKFLETDKGKRMLALARELEELLKP